MLVAFALSGGAQQEATHDAFDRLTTNSGLMAKGFSSGEGRLYRASGTQIRFHFVHDGRAGQIEFVCRPVQSRCGTRHDLVAQRGVGGDVIFLSAQDVPVVRLTPAGSGTLLGGAPFVPIRVPKKGLAFLPE
ncbi:hypothetical protein PB2503_01562 [Parvularcula bermudensis HTCC2503]|uniref:Uncharacterized protein n=1 Tax=Parvularcula bermudensis (strain ATCC BAA-594 / HTCC2503 / KCTC 12087) TaxID=314260 RepID=E0TBL6_PARBH|nr:hypothetical protein PB2503_01562 [Parvularcula bermudensis HTCC2503]